MNVLVDVSLNILKNYEPNSIVEKQKANLNYLHFAFPNHKKKVIRFGSIDYEDKTESYMLDVIKGSILFPKVFFKLNQKLAKANGIIICHGFGMPLRFMLLKLIAKNNFHVFVQHHAEQPFQNPIKLFFQRRAYNNADGYFFTSKENARFFISNGIIRNENKITEVMEGSTTFKLQDKNKCRKYLQIKEGTVFLWVGRLDQNKDPITVLKAFLNYSKQHPTACLYMIHSTSELKTEIEKFMEENDLKTCVKMTGEIPHQDLETWYNAADVYISTSHKEGSGYALCEALACGCFPVTTNIPSFLWMRKNIGMSFSKGNSEELLAVLNQLDFKNINMLRKEIRTHFEGHLSFEAIATTIQFAINQTMK